MHKYFKLNLQAIISNDERILLLQRNGKWTLPGGRYEEDDEDLERALRREIREETGITDVNIDKIVHATTSDNLSTVLLYFVATTDTVKIVTSDEHEGYEWVGKTGILDYEFEHELLKTIIMKNCL